MSKTAVITGGTRGIGLETVRLFAENGYHVVFYGSRKETVDKALAQLDGLEVEGKWTDLTDEEAIRRDFR
ncbi:SDR family NAD(P)-dependent oxidoreductase, partial [Faecalibaculum rodentium]